MPPARPPVFLTDFRDPVGCYERVADAFARGLADPTAGFHHFTLATADADGGPDARVVILRGFDPDAREVRFFTDVRSPKVDQLRRHPHAAMLFWDPDPRLQVKLTATVTLHHEDGTAAAAWGSCAESNRRPYAAGDGPGVELDPDADPTPPPAPALDDGFAFGNFVVGVCRFDDLDVLELHPTGNRRVRLTWHGGEPRLTRLAP